MKVKETQGITLIALIITIIVLLLLTGVAINTLVGNDGIIKNAENAVGKYNNQVTAEQGALNKLNGYFKENGGGDNPEVPEQPETPAEPTEVYANLYKISDTEYHLIYNSTGNVTTGYNEADRVSNQECSNGWRSFVTPWGYKLGPLITTCIIEDKIIPKSTAYYFSELSQITEIQNIENIDTSNVISMGDMFYKCRNLTNLNVSHFNTSNVTVMGTMFYNF